ncbi:hypothetical protein ACQJBY_027506 [Aegilops geniculata]
MSGGASCGDGPRPPEDQIFALSLPEIHTDPPSHCPSPAPSTQGAEGAQADPADADLAILHSAQTERWRIHFADERSSGGWIEGRLQHNPTSRWTGIVNLDNDVLVGDYLAADVRITVGSRLRFDMYDVRVDCRMQEDQTEDADLIDLTDTPKAGRSDHRFGGRFWVLADSDDEEDQGPDQGGMEVDDGTGMSQNNLGFAMTTPPSECSPVTVPYQKRGLQRKPVLHMKPWSGPIPKVNRAHVTLSDFIPDSWTLVTRKKNDKKGQPARPPSIQQPSTARAANEIQARASDAQDSS